MEAVLEEQLPLSECCIKLYIELATKHRTKFLYISISIIGSPDWFPDTRYCGIRYIEELIERCQDWNLKRFAYTDSAKALAVVSTVVFPEALPATEAVAEAEAMVA